MLLENVTKTFPRGGNTDYSIKVSLQAIDEDEIGSDFVILSEKADKIEAEEEAKRLAELKKAADLETNEFIDNMRKLTELANGYSVSTTDASSYTVNKKAWLPFQFIRNFAYTGTNWEQTGGAPDISFNNYVRTQNESLYNYFRDIKTIPGDEYGETKVDVKHMAAVVTAHMYTTNAIVAMLAGMTDKNFNDFAGWAGDLQSMVISNINGKIANGTYQQYYDLAVQTIGKSGTFGQDDMYADLDGVNLYQLILNGASVTDAVNQYYNTEYLTRKETFLNWKTREQFRTEVYDYVRAKEIIVMFQKSTWMLYSNAGIAANGLSDELVDGVTNAMVDYFYD